MKIKRVKLLKIFRKGLGTICPSVLTVTLYAVLSSMYVSFQAKLTAVL